jgi:hypothetical protein
MPESAPSNAVCQHRVHETRRESSGLLEAYNPHDAPESSDGRSVRKEGSANDAAATVGVGTSPVKGPAEMRQAASWKRRAKPGQSGLAAPGRDRSAARRAVTATALLGSYAGPECLFIPDALAHRKDGSRASTALLYISTSPSPPVVLQPPPAALLYNSTSPSLPVVLQLPPAALLYNSTSPSPPVVLKSRAGARDLPAQHQRPSSARAGCSPQYGSHESTLCASRGEVTNILKDVNAETTTRRPKGFRPVLGLQQLQLLQQQQHELTSSLKAASSIYRTSPRFPVTRPELRSQPANRRHAREQLLSSRYYM